MTDPFFSVQGLRLSPPSPFSPMGLSFNLTAGTLMAVMGASGCGKSRLLRALADLDPSEGTVMLQGQTRESLPAPAWRRRVVYLGADSGWWADDVGAHFAAPEQAKNLLEPFGLPLDAMSWSVARASTGERQRLALIRTLTLPMEGQHGRLYLLDEPTSALDPATTAAVEQTLRDILSPQSAVIMVTHSQEQAQRIANRILILRDGLLHEAPSS